MAFGPVKVTVSKAQEIDAPDFSVSSGFNASAQARMPSPKINKDNETAKRLDLAKTVAVQLARTAVSQTVGQYANLTGDYVTANKMQAATQIYGLAAMAMSSPAGAAAAAITVANQVISEVISFNKNEKQLKLLRRRMGMFYDEGRNTNE